MALKNTTLGEAAASLYTSIDSVNAVIVAYFCNTHPTDTVQFTVYAVPSGSAADMTTVIYNDVNLTSGDTYVLDTERLILDNGDGLYASASIGESIIATINTIEV